MSEREITIQNDQDEVLVYSETTGNSFSITRNLGVITFQLGDLKVHINHNLYADIKLTTENECYQSQVPILTEEPTEPDQEEEEEAQTLRNTTEPPPAWSTLPPPPPPPPNDPSWETLPEGADSVEFLPALVDDDEDEVAAAVIDQIAGQGRPGSEWAASLGAGYGFGYPPPIEEPAPDTEPVPVINLDEDEEDDDDDENGVVIDIEPNNDDDDQGGDGAQAEAQVEIEVESQPLPPGISSWLNEYGQEKPSEVFEEEDEAVAV